MIIKYVNNLKGWNILYDGVRPRLMYKRGRVIQFYDVERNDPLYIALKEREKKKEEEKIKKNKELMKVKVLERDYTWDKCIVSYSNTKKAKKGEIIYIVYYGRNRGVDVYNDNDEKIFSDLDISLIERDFSEAIIYD